MTTPDRDRRAFYDTEFVEDGTTIDFISIGVVRPDGSEYYAVSSDFDTDKARNHPFVGVHVWPKLPLLRDVDSPERYDLAELDRGHPDVRPRKQIAEEVYAFVTGGGLYKPRLYAYCSAFDHVALAWLYGPMVAMPDLLPHHTDDLKHMALDLGSPPLPEQDPATEHHALYDARHDHTVYEVLVQHAANQMRTRRPQP
jgi:hypothetical protein